MNVQETHCESLVLYSNLSFTTLNTTSFDILTFQPECKENGGVCATIFMDLNKKTDIVKEVKFKCACPPGHLCPAKIRDESKETEAQKEVKCQPIKQSHNKI